MLTSFRSALALAAILTIGFASTAVADALYFERVLVNSSSEATCYRFASDVARNLSLRNVKKNRLEVAGEKNGTYISVTCIGRGQAKAMAVVMVVSATFDIAKQVGTEVAKHLTGIVCFDSPC
jgi:hypothetical protein